jgi:predicted TIM-barrel fold metal-dependent hydrolase
MATAPELERPGWPFPIISADSHFTEPADLWTKHIDPAFRSRAPHVEHREETDVFVCDTADMFPVGIVHGVRYKGGDVKLNGRYEDVPASGYDPAARVADVERDGVVGEVLYPTIAMRFFTIEDQALANACIAAYNTWAAEFAASMPDRFKSIGIISLDSIPDAITEMERCREIGLSGVMIAVFPHDARPYHHADYLPFWEAAERLRLPVSLHTATERRVKPSDDPVDAFLNYTLVQRTLIGLIYAGIFDRFPDLQVISVENDAGWAANIIDRMDYGDIKARSRNLHRNHHNTKAPSHYWHHNISFTFMRDRSAIAGRHIIGIDRLMWSSDFPHSDSTWPDSQAAIAEQMSDIPEAEQRLILHDNAARMYGFK